jgi:hypothetical protein
MNSSGEFCPNALLKEIHEERRKTVKKKKNFPANFLVPGSPAWHPVFEYSIITLLKSINGDHIPFKFTFKLSQTVIELNLYFGYWPIFQSFYP